MGSLHTLNTALSGLRAHQRAIEVISHNVSNVATEGFTRRRVDMVPDGPGPVSAVWSRKLETGDGVRINNITRVREDFLEAQFRDANAGGGRLDAMVKVLGRIEAVFPEPTDNGLAEQLTGFWNTWHDVVNRPESEAVRADVLEQAGLLVGRLQEMDRSLRTVRTDGEVQVGNLVDQVNGYAKTIAELNEAIRGTSVLGQPPNDLLDERDMVLEKLSAVAGVVARVQDDRTISVFVGGRALVSGDHAEQLEVVKTSDPALAAVGFDRIDVVWKGEGSPANVASGELAGFLTGINASVPDTIRSLDDVAASLVTTVNTTHMTGQDLDGNTGLRFFNPTGTTARTIAISADVAGNPRRLAVAEVGAGDLDTTVGRELAALGTKAGGPDSVYATLVLELGTDLQLATRSITVQEQLVEKLDQDRKAISGVNLDEEMVALVAAQHAYAASARVMTAVDSMLETLINRTGVVGR